jgi:hypothetical protein
LVKYSHFLLPTTKELALLQAIEYPVEVHVDGLVAALLHGVAQDFWSEEEWLQAIVQGPQE